MRRDRCANERVIVFKQPGTVQTGASTSTEFDLRAGPAGALWNGREDPTNVLFIVNMSATVTATATLDVLVNTGDTSGATTLYATLGQMAWDTNTLWIAEVRDLQRYMDLTLTVGTAALDYGLIGVFNRSRREPIYQTANEAAATYARTPATG